MNQRHDSTAGWLVVGGFLMLVLAVFLALAALLIGIDEPQLALPLWVAAYIVGVVGIGMFVLGIALLVYAALRLRRRSR